MPMITKIETNFKGEDRVFEVSRPHIMIVGDNAAGKTSLVNAITLPLLGLAQDLGARDEAKAQSLLQWLIPPNSSRAYAKLTFSDGGEASWELIRGSRPKWVKPAFPVTQPFDEARAALRGSKATVLRYLVRNFGEDTSSYVPDYGVYAGIAEGKPYWQGILAVEEQAASDARAHKGAMNAVQKAAEAVGFDVTKPPPQRHRRPEQVGLIAAYEASMLQYEEADMVAKACLASLEEYVTHYKPQIEAGLRSDVLLQDVGIIMDKSQILIGRRQYSKYGTTTFPLTSGAETTQLALALAGRARDAEGTFALAILPDRDYDGKTKRAFTKFAKHSLVTMIAQYTRAPVGPTPDWEVIRV